MKLKYSEILAYEVLNFIVAGHHFAFFNKPQFIYMNYFVYTLHQKPSQLDNIAMSTYQSQPIIILRPNVDAPIQNSKRCEPALFP